MAAKDTITRILITAKDEASGVFGTLQRNAGKVATAIVGYFSAKLFGDSVKAAEDLDGQMRKLEGVIAATGGAAGLTADEIDDMARRLDEATLGSAAGFRDAAAQLLTFKSVGKDAFETTLMLAQDLAASGFGTLETNAVQLGKALEDPVKGLTALTRSGVTFTQEQQTLIKSLVETGRAAEAQGLILDAVAGQVGGVAQAMGGGLSGAIDLVSKRFTDMKEQLGEGALPVLKEFNDRLAALYSRLADSGAITAFGKVYAAVLDAVQKAFFKFVESFDLESITTKLEAWALTAEETVTKWGEQLSTASEIAKFTFDAIATGIDVIKTAFFTTAGVVADFASNVTGGMATVLEGLASVLPSYRTAAEEARAISDSFAESARINYAKAQGALEDTAASAEKLRDSFGNLIGVTDGTANAIDTVTNAAGDAGQAATLTADQLDDLGEGMEFVDGTSRNAAAGIDTVDSSAATLASTLDTAVDETALLAEAFATLKVESSAALQATADTARAAFDTIRNSGTASTRDIQAAFTAYANTAIAANDGVVSSTITAEGRMFGLKVEADKTGKVIVSAMGEAANAVGDVAGAANDAAGSVRGLRNELEGLRQDQQDGDVDPVNNVIDRRDPRSAPGQSGTDMARARGMSVEYEDVDDLDKAFNEAYAKRHADLMQRYSTTTNVSRDKYIKDMQRIEDDALAESLKRVKDANKAADAAQPTTTPKPAATSSGASSGASVGSSSPSAPVKSNTYTVNVNLAGKTTPINAASDADARKLIGLLQDLEARA